MNLRPSDVPNGVPGGSDGCLADATERLNDEFEKSPVGKILERQEELNEIFDEYAGIDEVTREHLRAKVEDRVQRYNLPYGFGDLEAAVVRMYRGSRSGESFK